MFFPLSDTNFPSHSLWLLPLVLCAVPLQRDSWAQPCPHSPVGSCGLPKDGGTSLRQQAQSNQDCCLSYSKVRLPRKVIKGFTEQLSGEVCDIDAIIFHTVRGLKACVNPKEDWVKKHLLFLSQKLKRMSM
ncbi:C-C motif chemokine 20 isoform X1 [Gallus gallus]|uniref:C-C motif chemokine 20 isoform X1 n=1 Tax=Gallus gallus TaxID=9031 RepID=UPI001F030700|nr:C-C motif chemokine 20 isoform X1 [Gallus gallus]